MYFTYRTSIDFTTYFFQQVLVLILLLFSLYSCTKTPDSPLVLEDKIRALDLSDVPKLESLNTLFYNENNQPEDVLTIAKNHDVNVIRLKIWKSPQDTNASFEQVKTFAQRIHSKNLKVWLTVHYSDTWADPGQQETPVQWQGISFLALKDSVYNYTQKIVNEIQPDYIQIGNEINNGFLFPYGNIATNESQFIEILSAGIQAVRATQNSTKIIVHFAGTQAVNSFFNRINTLDFDMIGLSYYPIWHGQDLEQLQNTLNQLKANFQKEIVIAETAYPFTLDWNDWTNNIVGLDNQLILPEYPASFQGQKDFLEKIKQITSAINGLGFCYWGTELVAFDGQQSTHGSPWENQALFDFNNKVVPAMQVFKNDY